MNKLIHVASTLLVAVALCAVATIVTGPATAQAQNSSPKRSKNTPAQKAAQKSEKSEKSEKARVKNIIFGEGSDIEGDVPGPFIENVTGRGDVAQGSLIRVRKNFLPEIYKSVERL